MSNLRRCHSFISRVSPALFPSGKFAFRHSECGVPPALSAYGRRQWHTLHSFGLKRTRGPMREQTKLSLFFVSFACSAGARSLPRVETDIVDKKIVTSGITAKGHSPADVNMELTDLQ